MGATAAMAVLGDVSRPEYWTPEVKQTINRVCVLGLEKETDPEFVTRAWRAATWALTKVCGRRMARKMAREQGLS